MRRQMLVPDLYVFTLKSLAYKKTKTWKEKKSQYKWDGRFSPRIHQTDASRLLYFFAKSVVLQRRQAEFYPK